MNTQLTFDQNERRVLGVLLEKALAQPSYYPMPLNAVVAACNQKQNRDPVMSLDEDDAYDALERLRKRSLVSLVLPGPGARTNRYRHEVNETLGLSKAQKAIVAELLLRGPQTVGELRSRASRMAEFPSLDAVSAVLDELAQRDPPMSAALPREPGRSAIRHTHLLYPEGEQVAASSPASTRPPESHPAGSSASKTTPAPTTAQPAAHTACANDPELQSLRDQVEALESEVTDLREDLLELRNRIDRLTGGA